MSSTQKKNNKKKATIRAKVEHPFAFMKEKLNYRNTVAKTKQQNDLRFTINCLLYNFLEQIICSPNRVDGERASNEVKKNSKTQKK